MPGKAGLITIAFAMLFGVAGCSGKGATGQSVSGSSIATGDGGIKTWSVGHRQMVRDVIGTTLQGKQLSLASYRGKIVIVDFWSQACGPCHSEEQAFEQLSKNYATKGVQFVGVDEQDNHAAGLAFERQYGVTYPSLFDQHEAYLLDFPGAAPPSTPTTIVLDPTGHIAAEVNGSLDYTHLQTLINDTLAEQA